MHSQLGKVQTASAGASDLPLDLKLPSAPPSFTGTRGLTGSGRNDSSPERHFHEDTLRIWAPCTRCPLPEPTQPFCAAPPGRELVPPLQPGTRGCPRATVALPARGHLPFPQHDLLPGPHSPRPLLTSAFILTSTHRSHAAPSDSIFQVLQPRSPRCSGNVAESAGDQEWPPK